MSVIKANSSVRLDDYNASRPYWVYWEGAEPIACTLDEAITQIWCARLCGGNAKYQDQRTHFAHNNPVVKSQDINLSDWHGLPQKVQEYLLADLAEFHLENLADLIEEILDDKPELKTSDSGQRYLALENVECWCETWWALRSNRAKYRVAITTPDDWNEILETMADREAAIRFAALVFEFRAIEKLKSIHA